MIFLLEYQSFDFVYMYIYDAAEGGAIRKQPVAFFSERARRRAGKKDS
jgi:hypothetical protein